MDDLEYIKNFNKITLTRACKKNKISRQNITSGKASKKTIKKVRRQIENDIAELYLMRESDEKRESSL